jgi:hypothetical protein
MGGLDAEIFHVWREEINYSNLTTVVDVLKWKLIDNAPWAVVFVSFCRKDFLKWIKGR